MALVTFNPKVGDIENNLKRMLNFIEETYAHQAQLVIFPEMSLVGYPPKDLLFFEELYQQQTQALNKIKRASKKISILVGGFAKNSKTGAPFQNVAYLFQNGQKSVYQKQLLPNYDVFDERRYFEPGEEAFFFKMGRYKFAVTICEDIWSADKKLLKRYAHNPLQEIAKKKPDAVINISASPFELGKWERREKLFRKVCDSCQCPLIYVNQSGANDDLIFEGGAAVLDQKGRLQFRAKTFEENLYFIEWDDSKKTLIKNEIHAPLEDLAAIEKALITGLHDYFHKSGFQKAVLGLSGGIDSALVAHLATKALGAENVLAVMLPSRYSSKGSITDSQSLIKNLKIPFQKIEIDPLHKAFEKTFKKMFGKSQISELTRQNIQARIRGNLLMAISNNEGSLLLNTTNKSELAMGYGTLYGDMCGALAVISDLTKEQVYDLAKFMNPNFETIPKSIFTKAPSAELKPDQKDSDNLPEYDVLDPILIDFVENFTTNPKHRDIQNAVFRNEYKRFQAPLGLKINEKAFGSGRRIPIVQKLST